MLRRFAEVDVFASTPLSGNPLAVVLDGDRLSDEEMQRLANWTNFSETSFVLPPTDDAADYRVRIFTPATELPFAGHPTLGTCHAWLAAGGEPRGADEVVQECGVGLVRLRRDDDRLAFAAPPLLRDGPVDEPLIERYAAALAMARSDIVDARWVDNGPGWAALLLDSADAVLAVDPDFSDFDAIDLGLVGPYPEGRECAVELRAFFGSEGRFAEDPVTGSLNASVAQWLLASGRLTTPYVASQGTALGRRGRVYVEQADGNTWIGGRSTGIVTGTVDV